MTLKELSATKGANHDARLPARHNRGIADHTKGEIAMHHYTAYINDPNRRVEVDAVNRIAAQRQAAMLLDTKRVHDIILIECTEPLCTVQDLIDDTEEGQ